MKGTDGNGNVYGTPVFMSGTRTETLLPLYGSGISHSYHPASGVSLNLPVCKKRTRDAIQQLYLPNHTFLGEDISLQSQYHQVEIDHVIAQHTEKVKLELEQRRRVNSRRIIQAVEAAIGKRLRSKQEEIDKITKLNYALEDKVKSLLIENQIWRGLAESNEATANALRSNLDQLLVEDEQLHNNAAVDGESCCGSNYEEEDDKIGLCRNCGQVESCVLLLPCRHLCLCKVCGSYLQTCPVCKSTKNASLHVNMSQN